MVGGLSPKYEAQEVPFNKYFGQLFEKLLYRIAVNVDIWTFKNFFRISLMKRPEDGFLDMSKKLLSHKLELDLCKDIIFEKCLAKLFTRNTIQVDFRGGG